jgi:hypothetical protein
MKKADLKQLFMPTIVTIILIIASFSIASKYELKSVIKQPLKINSSSNRQLDTSLEDSQESPDSIIQETDTTSTESPETHLLFESQPLKSIPKEVSIILLSRLQVSFPVPKGT